MPKKKAVTLRKPTLADVKKFAEAAQDAPQAHETAKATTGPTGVRKNVPDGDVRLTANVRQSLHLRLKIAAAKERSTIGELLERLIDKHID